jgi:hypothetical protein
VIARIVTSSQAWPSELWSVAILGPSNILSEQARHAGATNACPLDDISDRLRRAGRPLMSVPVASGHETRKGRIGSAPAHPGGQRSALSPGE